MGFDNLQFPKRVSTRVLPIKKLVPLNIGLNNFFAVMTEAYFVSDDSAPLSNFDELFTKLRLEKTENNLSNIRRKGLIYEGDKTFAPQLSHVFENVPGCSENAHIRSSESGKIWECKARDFFEAENIFALIDEDFGEFQITDEQNCWYCILRDFDPIVFFAVNDELSKQLTNCVQETAMVISPDFNCN